MRNFFTRTPSGVWREKRDRHSAADSGDAWPQGNREEINSQPAAGSLQDGRSRGRGFENMAPEVVRNLRNVVRTHHQVMVVQLEYQRAEHGPEQKPRPQTVTASPQQDRRQERPQEQYQGNVGVRHERGGNDSQVDMCSRVHDQWDRADRHDGRPAPGNEPVMTRSVQFSRIHKQFPVNFVSRTFWPEPPAIRAGCSPMVFFYPQMGPFPLPACAGLGAASGAGVIFVHSPPLSSDFLIFAAPGPAFGNLSSS